MHDELFDREYQAGREELHQGVDNLLQHLRSGASVAMVALHRIQWEAPWRRRSGRT